MESSLSKETAKDYIDHSDSVVMDWDGDTQILRLNKKKENKRVLTARLFDNLEYTMTEEINDKGEVSCTNYDFNTCKVKDLIAYLQKMMDDGIISPDAHVDCIGNDFEYYDVGISFCDIGNTGNALQVEITPRHLDFQF